MRELFSKRAKKIICSISLSCFLCSPVSYVFGMQKAAAAALDNNIVYENNFDVTQFDDKKWDRDHKRPHWTKDKWDDDDWKDHKRPHRPHWDKDDKWDKDDWKDHKRPHRPHWDKDDKWDDDDWKDHKRPHRPHWDKDKWHDDDWWEDRKDDDKDFDRGDVTAAVLIGGVIGAIIAKNT